ncbi:RHS repeat domain-containing protein [Bacteroides thetaiotaomicron]
MPGGNLNRYAYDKADRLICYQDHYQQQYSKWIISIPDQKGREVIKGVSVSSSINVPPISNTLVYAERYQGEGAMKSGYIIHDLLDMLNSEPKEVNYYDDYSFLSDYESTNTQQSLKYSFEDFPSWLKNKEKVFSALAIEPVGLQSGKRSYLDNNTYLLTALYYDKKGRIVQKRGTNHLGGYDIYFYSYTFTGLTKGQVHIQFDSNKKTIVAEYYNYEYDGGERLKQVIYRLNGGQEIVLAENEYDNLCRLKNVILNNGASTLNYNYNIRNWITSIDSPFFKQKLHYTDGAGSPCYNGNISSITWQAASSGISGYKFSYDDLNRMKDAIYGEGNNLNENSNHFNEQITGYDKNGNILGLKRFGQTSQNDYGLIDDLLLSYTGNRLLAVKDNAVNSAYAGNFEFSNGADKSVEYNYDVSGNLKNDLNKKITDIQYNYLNLPSLIKFENGSNISYLYSPEGAKLRTIHVTDKDTLITDYCGNVIYENEIPVKLLTEVGYVTLTDAVHHYFLQDYQGNNRVVIDNNNNVEEVNHYYPFGGVFASTSSVQPFKYNGKELDRKNGLDWYDYGARMYDAALGRWHVADPSSEKNYSNTPYGYCFNNPVTHIDPDGKQGVAIPTPYGPLPFYYPLTRTQSYNLPSDQQIMRHTSDKFAELGQMITDAPKMSYTFGSLLYYQVKSAVSPEYNHQRKRDRKAKENLDKNQANVANSIDTNVSGMMPNGDPAPKRDPNDKSKIGKAGKKVLIGSGIARTALELTTPDPTQDAYDAHTNQVVGKEEYSTNYIRDIFEWIIEQLKD